MASISLAQAETVVQLIASELSTLLVTVAGSYNDFSNGVLSADSYFDSLQEPGGTGSFILEMSSTGQAETLGNQRALWVAIAKKRFQENHVDAETALTSDEKAQIYSELTEAARDQVFTSWTSNDLEADITSVDAYFLATVEDKNESDSIHTFLDPASQAERPLYKAALAWVGMQARIDFDL